MADVFEFGAGFLTGLRNDIANPLTPRRFGTLQEVSVEFAGEVKDLFGSYQFPVDNARGKTKITGKAKFVTIKAGMYNDLFFGQTQTTGQLKYALNESATLTTGTPAYTVSNSGSTPLTDQGVFYASTGAQLEAVQTSAPSASATYNFNASTGVYQFSTNDASAQVLFNYTYHVATGQSIAIGNPPMGTTPAFKMTLFQQFEGNQIVLVLNKCVSTRLSYPTRIDDYVIQDMDFGAFTDGANNVGSLNVPA